MSARLTEDDLRELARLTRQTHARTAARHERERLTAGQEPCQCPACEYTRSLPGAGGGGHDGTG
jgi:hypothetical protein